MKKYLILICCLLSFACARKNVSTATDVTPANQTYRGENYKIGVVLPLTGKYAIYGESALHGIECGFGIFPPCDSQYEIELIIKDDVGDPLLAAQAVEALVNDDNVNIIIGPLSSSSIDAAALKAQELGIPLISLSQKEGIPSIGDNIFSVALTAASQVNAIV